MKKQFNELENCEVVVKVTENVIKMVFENGQKFVFEANKENYVILFPNDAHMPCMHVDGNRSHIRKIVVKVPMVY